VIGVTRERVLAAALKLDYVPHSGARSLSMRRTDTLGVILPDLHGEFFSELIRGIDQATRARGLHLLLSHSHGDPHEATAVLRAMRSRVDAMIVMSPYADEDVLSLSGRTPLVRLGGDPAAGGHPRLAIDNHAGALQMTAHLLALGHRHIAFIAGPPDNIEAAQRLAGYREGLSRGDAAIEQVVQGDFSEAAGMAAARQLAATRPLPDAIFAANDMMAIGCLQGLRGLGLRVPDDVALAGFDDIPISRFLDPSLTSVGVPIAELGRQAVECCVETLATGMAAESRTFTPALVVRASCGAVNPDRPESRPTKGDAQHDLRIV
jgi:LacI family transcriptional regulator